MQRLFNYNFGIKLAQPIVACMYVILIIIDCQENSFNRNTVTPILLLLLQLHFYFYF